MHETRACACVYTYRYKGFPFSILQPLTLSPSPLGKNSPPNMTCVSGCGRARLPPPPPPPLHGSFPPRTATFVSFIGVLRRIDNGGTAATSTLIVLERILETAAVFFHDFHVKFPPLPLPSSARFRRPSRYLLKLYIPLFFTAEQPRRVGQTE